MTDNTNMNGTQGATLSEKVTQYDPIVAIDVASEDEALRLMGSLEVKNKPILKIGMELYYGVGKEMVREAKDRGFRVFLDLKLYDIPNTVRRAMTAIGRLGVDFVTIHAAGGSEMLRAGLEGLRQGAGEAGVEPAKLLAITQLTSIDETILRDQQHVDIPLIESVADYAHLADECGLAGVVCSAKEVRAIREVTRPGFLCVTPGIRPSGWAKDDQRRVVTPQAARELGANAIVVGRPITRAADPVAAYETIRDEFLGDSRQDARRVAADLLSIHAVTLSPSEPFTWASGMHTPIYCDNRLTISYPQVRQDIHTAMSRLIRREFGDVDVIAGTATAGIPHAAWVAEDLGKPMIYVRSKPKDHGKGRQIEGVLRKGQRVVVIDDLVSTGGSVLKAVKAVQAEGAQVAGVVSIFSYQLPQADTNFSQAGVTYKYVTGYSTMIAEAEERGLVSHEEALTLHEWRKDPWAWSDAHAPATGTQQ
jgi:orotidine-5'-phosphate decarboxylase